MSEREVAALARKFVDDAAIEIDEEEEEEEDDDGEQTMGGMSMHTYCSYRTTELDPRFPR